MAKILNIGDPFDYIRTAKGTDYIKGDYNTKIKLYPVETTDGTFNLDRNEVLGLLANLGIVAVRLGIGVLMNLVGSHIDTSKISDK